jgi:hypothetical protein
MRSGKRRPEHMGKLAIVATTGRTVPGMCFGGVELDADLGYQRRLTHERVYGICEHGAQRLVRCRKDDLEQSLRPKPMPGDPP